METNVKLMVVLGKLTYQFLTRINKNLDSIGMNSSNYAILAHLNAKGKEKTQRLGEVAIISSGTITHAVSKLIQNGYVVKRQDPNDKRVYWVEITDLGRVEFNRVNDEHIVFLNKLLDGFKEEEKKEFIEQIKYFGKKIESENVE